jgi:hypothetical protein
VPLSATQLSWRSRLTAACTTLISLATACPTPASRCSPRMRLHQSRSLIFNGLSNTGFVYLAAMSAIVNLSFQGTSCAPPLKGTFCVTDTNLAHLAGIIDHDSTEPLQLPRRHRRQGCAPCRHGGAGAPRSDRSSTDVKRPWGAYGMFCLRWLEVWPPDGTGMACLLLLTVLRDLILADCQLALHDTRLHALAPLTALQHLDLSYSGGAEHSSLSRLAALTSLTLLELIWCIVSAKQAPLPLAPAALPICARLASRMVAEFNLRALGIAHRDSADWSSRTALRAALPVLVTFDDHPPPHVALRGPAVGSVGAGLSSEQCQRQLDAPTP